MALVTAADKIFQGGNLGAVLARLQLDPGQRRLAGAPIGQELLFDPSGPGQRLQHTNPAGQTGQGGIEF